MVAKFRSSKISKSHRKSRRRTQHNTQEKREMINKLPHHLIHLIHSFVCIRPHILEGDYLVEYEYEFDDASLLKSVINWKNLMNTIKQFKEIKSETVYLSLNKMCSREFTQPTPSFSKTLLDPFTIRQLSFSRFFGTTL
jgi:hypothetical protein